MDKKEENELSKDDLDYAVALRGYFGISYYTDIAFTLFLSFQFFMVFLGQNTDEAYGDYLGIVIWFELFLLGALFATACLAHDKITFCIVVIIWCVGVACEFGNVLVEKPMIFLCLIVMLLSRMRFVFLQTNPYTRGFVIWTAICGIGIFVASSIISIILKITLHLNASGSILMGVAYYLLFAVFCVSYLIIERRDAAKNLGKI